MGLTVVVLFPPASISIPMNARVMAHMDMSDIFSLNSTFINMATKMG